MCLNIKTFCFPCLNQKSKTFVIATTIMRHSEIDPLGSEYSGFCFNFTKQEAINL